MMPWLLVGYMLLFIHRPFEIWPILGDIHIERVYIAFVSLLWLVSSKKRWVSNLQHFTYFGFAAAILCCWMLSPWAEKGQQGVENWFKILFFYILLVTVGTNPKSLRTLAFGFLLVMCIYMLHSFKEFLGGRHTYRMGIVRMIGVDTSLGDPNSFGASIVFALPLVTAFWGAFQDKKLKLFLLGYVALSMGCILLTGSRSSLLGLIVWGAIIAWRSSYRWRAFAGLIFLSPLVFVILPESLQNRFETIIDPDVGPENAKVSGEGRLEGLITGFELLAANPLNGVGPGAWRPATGSEIESHNLLGQLVGEMGLLGILTFGSILIAYTINFRSIRKLTRRMPELKNSFESQLASSIMIGIFLMLFLGMFGHNLFRHNWLWYGGFLILARYSLQRQVKRARIHLQSWSLSIPEMSDRSSTQAILSH
jgi:O-antigen ligase